MNFPYPTNRRIAVSWIGGRCNRADAGTLILAGFSVLTFGSLTHDLEAAAANKRNVMIVAVSPLDRDPLRRLSDLVSRAGRGIKTLALLDSRTAPFEAISAGVSDALHRDVSGDHLVTRVHAWDVTALRERRYVRALAELRDGASRKDARLRCLETENEALRGASPSDPLTGLVAGDAFVERLEHTLAVCSRYGGPVALIALELDGLAELNRSAGQLAGDFALRRVSTLLRSFGRASDLAGRLRGGQFALLLPATDLTKAGRVAERLRELLRSDATHPRLTVRFGVAALPQATRDRHSAVDRLLIRATGALDRAKADGRTCVAFCSLGQREVA
jgi:diguanylate cyclase (GGDEF)-like protein